MAYNTKLYKSTGSGWDEVRVGSEWGLIANKPSTFTPTAHSHPEYLSLAGGTLNGSLSANGDISAVGKIYSAPTSDSDPDDTVATKGYVDSKSSLHRVVTITSGITIDDNYKHNDLIICNSYSEIQINTKSSTNHPIGTRIDFYRRGAGRVKFYPQSGSIVAKSAPYYIKERYMAASLIKISQTEWLLIGALSTS